MFERYTETARRALFFARYEASQAGSLTITTELLLLGLVRADAPLLAQLLGAGVSTDDIRRDAERHMRPHEKISTSVEIPFDAATKRALQYAAEEADGLAHDHIGTEHLILGLLRDDTSAGGGILMNRGVTVNHAREVIAKWVADNPGRSFSPEAAGVSALIHALNHLLDRLATAATGKADAVRLLTEIRERVSALERQFGRESE